MERLRFGIVGTGIMARHHAAALAAYHRSEVVAVASPRAAEQDLSAFGPVRVHGDAESLAADAGVDAIVVATPDHAHAGPAIAAARAGKHVLVEKPLATTTADARAIAQAVHDARVVGMTLFNHRWVPAYWQARERIATGELGTPLLAYARKNDTIEVPTTMLSWADRTTPSWFLSSHDIDLVLWFFEGTPVEVYASEVRKVLRARGIDTPDAVQAQVRLADGAVATFEACWTYPNSFPTMTDSFVEAILTDGVIHLDRKREQIEVASPTSFQYPRNLLINRVGGKPSGSAYQAVCHFVDAVLDGQPPLVTLESSVTVTRVLEAIQRSCEDGAAVRIEQEGADEPLRVG